MSDKIKTSLLKIMLAVLGAIVLVLASIVLIAIFKMARDDSFRMSIVLYTLFTALLISLIPFSVIIITSIMIVRVYENADVFCDKTSHYLKRIRISSIIMFCIHLLLVPVFFTWGQVDDAPGVILVSGIFTASTAGVMLFSMFFESIFNRALEIKLDNDLTV